MELEMTFCGEEEAAEPVSQSCSRCSVTLGEEAQSFDTDTCPHPVCVNCRFSDDKCVVCSRACATPDNTASAPSDAVPPDFKYFKRKTFNTDHIVDVEDVDETGCHKQMCTVCQRVFKSSNARYHYTCATGDKPFSCTECSRKFVKKSHLQIHLNNHYGIKPFKCTEPKCKASFTQKDKLNRHMKTHNKENKKSHNCPVCNKDYTSQDILKVHLIKVHSSDKTFQCDLCPRSYKYSKSLRIHRLKHQAKKLYMCETCGKKYTLAAQLKIHKRSHIPYQRRAYKCSCGCRFITRRDKLRHQLIHVTTSKDFECSLCNTTFGRKDNLERHMKNFHQDNPPISSKTTKASTINKSATRKKNKEGSSVADESGAFDKSNAKRKKNTKNTSQSSSVKDTTVDFKTSVVDLSINKSNVTKSNKIIPDPIKSTVIPPLTTEAQNRPSVIKSVPKLLPYRVIPTNNISQKAVPNYPSNQSSQSNVPLVTKSTSERKHVQTTKIKKDLAYNKCFRIIHHTSSILSQQQISNLPFQRGTESNFLSSESCLKRNPMKKVLGHSSTYVPINTSENSSMINLQNQHTVENVSCVSIQLPEKLLRASGSNFPGGPTLPTTLQENIETSQEENFSNTYAPISETNDSSYTPYFESDSFRETVNNNYGDFDIGFQYESETFSYSETSSSGASKIVKSMETKVIKHL